MKIYNKIVYDFDNNIIEEDSYEYEGPLTLAGPTFAAAATVAAPYVVGAVGVAQYSAQGKIGKYNQSVSERNAQVLLGQKDQIEAKAEFDIAQFQKDFKKIEGETRVALATSGVELGTGSAYNIELSNAYEAKLQENLIKYNSEVAANNKQEEANFARIRGTMARQESKLAQINTVASTGSNIYSMMNKPKGTV
jgi:hypothetical protein